MTLQTYYRGALTLPLVVPALASPLMFAGDQVPGVVGVLVFFLFYSMMLGGIPYLLFLAGFLLWARGKPDRQLRVAILFSPVTYSAVLFACTTLVFGRDDLSRSLDALDGIVGFGMLFGYAYVALAELGRVLLKPDPTRLLRTT